MLENMRKTSIRSNRRKYGYDILEIKQLFSNFPPSELVKLKLFATPKINLQSPLPCCRVSAIVKITIPEKYGFENFFPVIFIVTTCVKEPQIRKCVHLNFRDSKE